MGTGSGEALGVRVAPRCAEVPLPSPPPPQESPPYSINSFPWEKPISVKLLYDLRLALVNGTCVDTM